LGFVFMPFAFVADIIFTAVAENGRKGQSPPVVRVMRGKVEKGLKNKAENSIFWLKLAQNVL
jgi:hypothetical protein